MEYLDFLPVTLREYVLLALQVLALVGSSSVAAAFLKQCNSGFCGILRKVIDFLAFNFLNAANKPK